MHTDYTNSRLLEIENQLHGKTGLNVQDFLPYELNDDTGIDISDINEYYGSSLSFMNYGNVNEITADLKVVKDLVTGKVETKYRLRLDQKTGRVGSVNFYPSNYVTLDELVETAILPKECRQSKEESSEVIENSERDAKKEGFFKRIFKKKNSSQVISQ